MTTLWRPDPELQEARKLGSWAAFHQAIGESNLHTQNERREYGEYVVPFYSLIRGQTGVYRQKVSEGYGSTVVVALARGFLQLSGGGLLHRAPTFRARLALLDLLLE